MNEIIQGDVLEVLSGFDSESMDTIITSPPYWGLRDYGIEGQIGLEKTLDEYIEKLFAVCQELKRVLKKTGVMFWNHGDSYGGTHVTYAEKKLRWQHGETKNKEVGKLPIPTKCLALQNYRLIFRLIDDGWILRNTIIWHKPNHMPSSVKDRFSNAYEPVFMLTKSKKYYFDLDAVRVPHKDIKDYERHAPFNYRVREPKKGHDSIVGVKSHEEEMEKYDRKGMRVPGQNAQGIHRKRHSGYYGANGEYLVDPRGKNPSDVWKIATQPFPEAHFATFPEKLIEPMIKAGCPKEGAVLDPFAGAGTSLVVAKKLGRKYIGIELNVDFVAMSEKRLNGTAYQKELLEM